MGLVYQGPPKGIILKLSGRHGVKVFIETGTYYGETAVWAASHFDTVITIEYSRRIYDKAVSRYGKTKNIEFVYGDSRSVLKNIVEHQTSPAVFWLDSHWSGGETYGEQGECPLLEEIHEIVNSDYTHFIFIDDARLFLSPPPQPHRIEHWPPVDKVIQALNSEKHQYHIVIVEDVIIAVPFSSKQIVDSYCQELNTKAHLEHVKQLEASLFNQGWASLAHGTRLILKGIGSKLKRAVFKIML